MKKIIKNAENILVVNNEKNMSALKNTVAMICKYNFILKKLVT